MFGYDFYSILNSSNKIRFFLIIIFIIYIMEKFIIKINFFNNKVNSTIIFVNTFLQKMVLSILVLKKLVIIRNIIIEHLIKAI